VRQSPGDPTHNFFGFDQLHRPDLTNNLRKPRIAQPRADRERGAPIAS
jgi:hypothetical protein